MIKKYIAATLMALASAGAIANPQNTTVDFSSGTQGWIGLQGEDGIGTHIDNSMGNGTPGLHTDYLYTGLLFWNQSNQNFLGNYTSAKSVSFGIDVNTHSIDSGGTDGAQYQRDFIVELRHYTTPGDNSKYISIWHTLGTLDNSIGASHFSATIGDTNSAVLNSGWQVYDSATGDTDFSGGTSFNGVLSTIDEIRFGTWTPGYSYEPNHYDATIDNISIQSAVPEADSVAMMLSGLGLLGLVARRRREKQSAGF